MRNYSNIQFFLFFLNLFVLIFSNEKINQNAICRAAIGGDCDPYSCGGSCEAKYVRFYDKLHRSDRTIKSCTCQQERLCLILGMHGSSGCKSYSALSSSAQKYVRHWSMDNRDRRNRLSNHSKLRFSERERHLQLLNGNSRFCCRSTIQNRYALYLKSSANSFNFYIFPSIFYLIFLL